MSQELRQSTTVTVKMGPFLDSTDGNSEEPGLTIERADVRLSKNGGAYGQKTEVSDSTHDENGFYGVLLDVTDTGTLGRLDVYIHVAGALYVLRTFMVITANAYDSKHGSDKRQVDVVEIGGDTDSATDLKDFADTGYDPVEHEVLLVNTTTTNTDMVGTDSANTTVPPTVEEIADGVWDEAKTGHIDAGKAGEQLWTDIDAIPTTPMRGTDSAATASDLVTHDGKLDTAQNDLDKLTGADGATLATLQGNYAPAKAGDEMALINGSIKLATYDGSTAFPLVATDSGVTQVARVGADGDTLKDLSDNLAVIESELDGLIVTVGTAGAGLTGLGGMSAGMKVEVNDQVKDVFVTDTYAQPSGVLAATASLKDMLVWIAVMNRNKLIATGSDLSLRNDGDSGDIAVAPISSDVSETIRGEFV